MTIINPTIDRKITMLQVTALVKKDVITNAINERRAERAIKKSQKKIGEYVATPFCKTITA
jgi:hypothetical protein